MLSKNQIKLIKSLNQKKYRQELGLFTVEGIKGVQEFLSSDYHLNSLFSTAPIFDDYDIEYNLITESELKKISQLKNPNKVLAVFKIPDRINEPDSGLIIALDDVRDPGNLGTIIRLCDWFGITDLVCSLNTVDCYNFKVVQASMGSLTRVNVHYLILEQFFKGINTPVFGTYLDGESIFESDLPSEAIVVLGNEANGISKGLEQYIDARLTIPQFGESETTESLNVANATAIILSEFKRKSIEK